jgi:hypothetical protein
VRATSIGGARGRLRLCAATGRVAFPPVPDEAATDRRNRRKPTHRLTARLALGILALSGWSGDRRGDEMATRGFSGKARPAAAGTRLPPGQFVTEDFPVLSAGPTPRIALEAWRFTLRAGPRPVKQWSWREFISLPMTTLTRDIHYHCAFAGNQIFIG